MREEGQSLEQIAIDQKLTSNNYTEDELEHLNQIKTQVEPRYDRTLVNLIIRLGVSPKRVIKWYTKKITLPTSKRTSRNS